ncbi:NPK1-related protein kinase 2 [Actinidia rufa]|uniref:mitogen-activated protein kinase kinase kinase n=1 Tax=Actinidia rufa TaxID=165716 RepID=A0A7J0GDJ2_9ERIC|nr:NPK1-related protein kinase 2 [Actinidia rufa]
MQDIIGSVRRSLVFKPSGGDNGGGFGGFVEKIGSSIRKSRIGLFSNPSIRSLPPISKADSTKTKKEDGPPIRWRKGELIGCGAFGRVYMGMNLDSGELLAVKQVSIAVTSASKDKTQRYLGTAREEESLNILLEFVPGGSISSLLGKFGSFPESVIRMYTKQLLLGLEYLHKNGIMHRDIKGANILVDNKGCIKLADFGASKKVVELVTITGAKSMKGTPYWMAPEVILQTGHSFSADIWSVGCTVIEMATGKPPWSQQYQEHPFVTGHYQETNPTLRVSVMENPGKRKATPEMELKKSTKYMPLKDVRNSVRCSTIYPEKFSRRGPLWGSSNCDDDMCQIDDKDDLVVGASMTFDSALLSDDLSKSFNPMSEPNDDWPCKFDESPELEKSRINFSGQIINNAADMPEASCNGDKDFTFPSGPSVAEDDDEVTETKIKAFLDEKALDLKKLQTPLYEEFYNSLNASGSPSPFGIENKENMVNNLNLPPKSRSPKRLPSRRLSAAVDVANTASCGTHSQRVSNIGTVLNQTPQEVLPSEPSEWKEVLLDAPQELISPSASFSDRQRKWEEELYEELERKRGKFNFTC